MDSSRFDALVRDFGRRRSRRGLLRGLAKAGAIVAAARIGVRSSDTAARHCRDYGCGCDAGVYNACRSDLVCCPWSPGVPGGLGLCLTENECYGPQCLGSGEPCAYACGWDASCDGCCSGYCDDNGLCGIPRCTGTGCACATGTYLPCDPGLSCCALQPGVPGGPGVCAPDGSC
jgi:hypothetical protein